MQVSIYEYSSLSGITWSHIFVNQVFTTIILDKNKFIKSEAPFVIGYFQVIGYLRILISIHSLKRKTQTCTQKSILHGDF